MSITMGNAIANEKTFTMTIRPNWGDPEGNILWLTDNAPPQGGIRWLELILGPGGGQSKYLPEVRGAVYVENNSTEFDRVSSAAGDSTVVITVSVTVNMDTKVVRLCTYEC